MNNLIRTLWQKRCDRGMTLVELLVVIFIIGILSGIAWLSFLSIVGKAKEVEATLNMGNLSKSQKGYYIEKDEFTIDISQLNFAFGPEYSEYDSIVSLVAAVVSSIDGVEVYSKEVENYIYFIIADNDDEPMAINLAVSKIKFARTYAGVVYMKEGDIYSCIPEPIQISLKAPPSAYKEVLSDVMLSPDKYCPGILE